MWHLYLPASQSLVVALFSEHVLLFPYLLMTVLLSGRQGQSVQEIELGTDVVALFGKRMPELHIESEKE
jgi:hypothetical protein